MKKDYMYFFLIIVFFTIRPFNVYATTIPKPTNNGGAYTCDAGGNWSAFDTKQAVDVKEVNYAGVKEIWNINFTDTDLIQVAGYYLDSSQDNTDNDYWLVASNNANGIGCSSNGSTIFISAKKDGTGGKSGSLNRNLYYYNVAKAVSPTYYLLNNRHSTAYRDAGNNCGSDSGICNKILGLNKETVGDAHNYSNVEFKLELSLQKLYETFEDPSESIYLYLVAKVNNKYIVTRIFTRTEIENNSNMVDNESIENEIGTSKVTMNASSAYVRDDEGKIKKNGEYVFAKFADGKEFEVVASKIKTNKKPYLYALKYNSKASCKYESVGGNKSILTQQCEVSPCSGSNCAIGYAYSTWLKTSGSFYFNFDKSLIKCENSKPCIGGNCDDSFSRDKEGCLINPPGDIEEEKDLDKQINDCSDTTDTQIAVKTITKTYYYKQPAKITLKDTSEFTLCNTNDIDYVTEGGGITYYYVPIKFSTNIKYTQNYVLDISDEFLNLKNINTGRFFPFSYNYSVSYNASTMDSYELSAPTYTGINGTFEGNVGISYKDLSVADSVCQKGNVNIRLKTGDTLYIKEADRTYEKYIEYGPEFYEKMAGDNKDDAITKNTSLTASAEFPDSNKYPSTESINPGSFSCNYAEGTYNCYYKINDAYYDKNGNYYYDKSEKDDGYEKSKAGESIYFIPLNHPPIEPFEFTIKSNSLNIIDGLGISLEATCTISQDEIKDEIHNSDNLIYRVIDLKNPFPKGKGTMKKNWIKYSQSDPTFSRLSYTLSGGVAYETNMFGNSSRKSVDALKNDSKYGFYNEFKDLTIDGYSSILDVKINNSNLFSNTDGRSNSHHCVIGKYDSSICDKPMW